MTIEVGDAFSEVLFEAKFFFFFEVCTIKNRLLKTRTNKHYMVSLDLRILPQGQQTILLMYYDSIASESSSDGGTLLDLNIGTPTVPSNLIYAVFPPMKFSICLSLTCINCSTFIVDFLNLRLIVNFALLAMQLISGTLGGGGGGARHDALAAGVLHRLGLGGALSSHPHVAPILPPPPPPHLPSA